jgi:hypothetical protein
MSRGRHSPPGHGEGKFVEGESGRAEGMPRVVERRSCSVVTRAGVISRALAASVSMPIELWK